MGSFSVWYWIIGLGILGFVLWMVVRAPNQSPAPSPPDISTESIAYQVGRKFRRTIQGATHRADAAHAKSRVKLELEAKAAKYDALAKLKVLHDSGVISDGEFEKEKAEILGQ